MRSTSGNTPAEGLAGNRSAGGYPASAGPSSWIEKAGLGAHRAKVSTVPGRSRASVVSYPDPYERLRGNGTATISAHDDVTFQSRDATRGRASQHDGRRTRSNLRVISGAGDGGTREEPRAQGGSRPRTGSRVQRGSSAGRLAGSSRADGLSRRDSGSSRDAGSRYAMGPHARLAASSPHTSWGFRGDAPVSSRGHAGRIGGEVERGIQGTAHLGTVPGMVEREDDAANGQRSAGKTGRLRRMAGLLRTPSRIPAAFFSWCHSL